MIMKNVLYLLLTGPVFSFVRPELPFYRELQPHVFYSDVSSTLVHKPDLLPLVEYTMREAQNSDTNIVIAFLDELRTFHDCLLIGDTTPQQSSITTPLIQEGDTIQSLMPHIRNCHVILAAQSGAGSEGIDIASVNDEIIGFASYHLRYAGFGPPFMHMEHLFVHPNCRSKGAGLALMNELAKIGKQYRCSHMEWSVHKGNKRGVQFYHRIGAISITNQQVVVDSAKSSKSTSGGNDTTSTTMKWIPGSWDL